MYQAVGTSSSDSQHSQAKPSTGKGLGEGQEDDVNWVLQALALGSYLETRQTWTNSCCSHSSCAVGRDPWACLRPAQSTVTLMRNAAVEGIDRKAKYLSGFFTLRGCQKAYKNVIVSQLPVIILPFTLAVGNKKKKKQISFFSLLWPSPGLFQTIID